MDTRERPGQNQLNTMEWGLGEIVCHRTQHGLLDPGPSTDATRTMACKDLRALRAEMEEQTKEIQKLQKEVEKATQNTINQLSISYREQCWKSTTTNNHIATRESTTSSSVGDHPRFFPSVPLRPFTLESSSYSGQTVNLDEPNLFRKYSLKENTLSGTSCPVNILNEQTTPIKDSHRELDQVKLKQPHVNQPTSGIHLKLQELIRGRTSEEYMRQKGSISQEKGIKLDLKVQKLESTNVIQEEMLKQARVYTELLKEKLQKQDQILQDTQKAILIFNEKSNKRVEDNFDLSNLGIVLVQTLQELSDEVSFLKSKIEPAEDQLNFMKGELKDKEASLKQLQESYDNLVNEHEQERALLVTEMAAVRSLAQSIQTRLETSQDQNTKQAEHITSLESKVSQLQSDLRNCKKTYKDKMEELKHQLSSANGSLKDLKNEHSLCKQEYGGQLLHLSEALKTCETQLNLEKEHNKQLYDREIVNGLTNENLQRELIERRIEVERLQAVVNMTNEECRKKTDLQLRTIQEKTASLNATSSQLKSIKDALQKTTNELTAKSQCLDHTEKSLMETRNILSEKDKSLQRVVDELKKLRLYAESKKREVQQTKADNEKMTEIQRDADTLKLLLAEKDNMIITLREQIEAMTIMIGQQNQKVEALEVDKSQLLREVSVKKAEIQDIAVRAENREKRLEQLEELCTGLELEKSKLANFNTKKILATKKVKKERDEIMVELLETRSDLANLAEDYEALKRKCENQTRGKENTTTILKMQLKAAMVELEQTKNTLNTVEDCDGHAVKIATRMQKKITVKREQIDMLQSRVHFLEEALSNATKDKNVLKVEQKTLMQECILEATGRQKLSETVENLKTENNTLKENLTRTEAALEKTMLQLSECQAVIQLLEQEAMRLRLQHTLDLQELRGSVPTDLLARSLHLRTAMSLLHCKELPQPQNKKQNHFCDAVTISADKVIKPSEDPINFPGCYSLFKDEASLKLRKIANCSSDHVSKEPSSLFTADYKDEEKTMSVGDSVETWLASSPKKHIPNQEVKPKSPVHCLLTAAAGDINVNGNEHGLALGGPASGFVSGPYDNLQHRLECLQTIANDLQTKNKEISLIFGTADENIFR
ncbi:coiled-coil domain-containing protein 158 [Anomaloglossus baeobatrachus]|uniref:coiled-coil domain-containing protein 158 n=1 Tax=Anomaloglossus baeobatrachus TaxID=238106 RepID=UPI003F4F5FDE